MNAKADISPLSESDLCAGFIAAVEKPGAWRAYAETAGFDILLVRQADGVQIGIEAKLALNPRVVAQALPRRSGWYSALVGPDFRAVLVPADRCNSDVGAICGALGITVLQFRGEPGGSYYPSCSRGPAFVPDLPREDCWSSFNEAWHEWAPLTRCALPEYVPDVAAGTSAPVALTLWKVKAIRLAVLLEDRPVTRADFKHLELSPSRWTDPHLGWLRRTPQGYVPGRLMPDFRAQHPKNYAEIRADRARWEPQGLAVLKPIRPQQGALL